MSRVALILLMLLCAAAATLTLTGCGTIYHAYKDGDVR